MRKDRLLLFVSLILMLLQQSVAQNEQLPHISSKFSIDTSIILQYYTEEHSRRELIGKVHNNVFYFCQTKAYQLNIENKARIFTINLSNKSQSFFDLTLPIIKNPSYGHISTFWISGLAFSDNHLVVFAQDKIIFYQKEKEEEYHYQKTIYLYNVQSGYFNGKYLYAFQNYNREGFELVRYDTAKFKKQKVKIFLMEAPFLLQFTPNRYLSIEDDAFYILETNRPQYKKYDLDGKLLDSVNFTSFMEWEYISASLIKEVMQLKYGVDRIYYALKHNDKNSYPCKIFPFGNGQSLIVYHQYHFEKEREMYSIAFTGQNKKSGEFFTEYLRYLIYDNDFYSDNFFPIYFLMPELSLSHSYDGTLIQISKEPDCSFLGKKEEDYKEEKENFFKINPPTLTARFFTLKNDRNLDFEIWDSLVFKNYENLPFQLRKEHQDQWILLWQPSIYCQGCLQYILSYFNNCQIDTSKVKYGMVMEESNSYMIKQEKIKEIDRYFNQSYKSCFIDKKQKEEFLLKIEENLTNPLVILIDFKKKNYFILTEEDIFTETTHKFEFKTQFKRLVNSFLSN